MKKRFEFIDATRALFAFQGVLFHALLPYREDKASAIKSPETLDGVSVVVTWLHSFRMQGFFLISGVLCWQLLQRQGATEYVRSRAIRLALPFVTVFLTVNVAERAMHKRFNPHVPSEAGAFDVGHLWFIAYLFLFALALPLVSWIIRRRRLEAISRWCSAVTLERQLPVILALCAAATVLGARTSTQWWYSTHLGFLQPVNLLLGASYFLVGAFVAGGDRVELLARRPSPGYWFGAIFGWLAIGAIGDTLTGGSHSASAILEHIYGIFVLRILFWAAGQMFAQLPRTELNSAVDATMTIYLLHHAIVVSGALLMLSVPWHPGVEILLLLFFGLSLPFVFHERVIRRVPLASLLLNGSRRAPQVPQAVPAAAPVLRTYQLTSKQSRRANATL